MCVHEAGESSRSRKSQRVPGPMDFVSAATLSTTTYFDEGDCEYAAPKHKGKISCSVAAKAALAIRCDALGDGEDNTIGLENRAKARLRNFEGRELGHSAGSIKGKPKIEFYDKDRIDHSSQDAHPKKKQRHA
ncbi:hypothetical protein CASFOL_000453 [Castilleja foliolosa]|uniref:Uncharacterized protein n=1 Tax=Castilleja foliolosa TaxID=1961234 RepID=A0ABD3ENQ3_9LAMI